VGTSDLERHNEISDLPAMVVAFNKIHPKFSEDRSHSHLRLAKLYDAADADTLDLCRTYGGLPEPELTCTTTGYDTKL
jgi:hypothetical protein